MIKRTCQETAQLGGNAVTFGEQKAALIQAGVAVFCTLLPSGAFKTQERFLNTHRYSSP